MKPFCIKSKKKQSLKQAGTKRQLQTHCHDSTRPGSSGSAKVSSIHPRPSKKSAQSLKHNTLVKSGHSAVNTIGKVRNVAKEHGTMTSSRHNSTDMLEQNQFNEVSLCKLLCGHCILYLSIYTGCPQLNYIGSFFFLEMS